MEHKKTALVIGRFQPFHKGHLHLLNEALWHADKIIIAVGSSNIKDENNPLSYRLRKRMLEKVIIEEKISEKVIKIVPSQDDPSDDKWLELLLKNTGKFDMALGNNDWTNNVLKNAGYKVIVVPHVNRLEYQGVLIRELLKKRGNWQKRVPAYLVGFIEKNLL